MTADPDRQRFLGRLRAALAGGLHADPLRPVEPIGEGDPPPVSYAPVPGDTGARLLAAAGAAGAEAAAVTQAELPELVGRLCRQEKVATAVLSADPECDLIAPVLERAGVAVLARPAGRSEAAGADLGVTGALTAIASTGSVVVSSTVPGARWASLLPRVHLAVVRPERLVAQPAGLLRHLHRWAPGGLPSNLVCITGPSRSADIELELTLGVHGPRAVWVALLG
ncbi:MAG TPA: LUD domain-containing protein [Acidimicrobiales bacterium]|nr:LUD domain-containing protein [Acidimicrobiales bacterium]